MIPMQQQPSHPLLPGVLVGHDTDQRRPTGVTDDLLPEGTTTGVDVRGAAPGTRETDLLQPVNTMQGADAVMLSGGSAFGLDAAGGVMGWLEGQGRGVQVGAVRVPIVPAAVIFDLWLGDPAVRPDTESGARACAGAVPLAEAPEGNVGAGAGASVGKLLGPLLAMRGGLGIASVHAHGLTVSAVVVVNAVGDVIDPEHGPLVGARAAIESLDLAGSVRSLLGVPAPPGPTSDPSREPGAADDPGQPGSSGSGANTTIGVIVTDAALSKTQATRMAQVAHDGLARTISPVHTSMDGDTLFAAATGTVDPAVQGALPPDALGILLPVMAAEATAHAVLRAIRAAEPLRINGLWLPAWRDRAEQASGG